MKSLTLFRYWVVAPVVLCLLGGCAVRNGVSVATAAAPRPAAVSHIVFIKLKDPADTAAIVHDSNKKLARIPVIASFAAGTHLDVGRANIESDYDVGLYVGFETKEDYLLYVDHQIHIDYVTNWRPRIEWIRVYDVLDEDDAE